MNTNAIIKKVFFALEIELSSPLNVSNGDDKYTDKDILTTKDGKAFVPGTSIAGALRNAISRENQNLFAGFSNGTDGKMSSVYFSDLVFEKCRIITRDGVKLLLDKSVENKFDLQAIETFAAGTMFIEFCVREDDEEELFYSIVEQLILGIQSNEIRFGANKNRGFGCMNVLTVNTAEFTAQNLEEYIEFDKFNVEAYKNRTPFTEWSIDKKTPEDRYVKISVPLSLTGGISIKKYSTVPKEADYEQISICKNNKKIPVIPGSSWNGAIRSDVFQLLQELGDSNAAEDVKNWFGYIRDNDADTARQSVVVIGESRLNKSKPLMVTRNRINRFDASTMEGALYTERSYFGGETILNLMVRKDEDSRYEALIGALLLVVSDIQSGFLQVGGLASIGRGMFEKNGEIEISEGNEATYKKALFTYLKS